MMTRALLAVAVAVSAASCQHSPKLPVRAVSSLSYRELIDRSPIVVVGRVAGVKVVGPEVRSSDEQKYPLRLQRITIQVENVLKGPAQTGEIAFYRYGWSPDQPMTGPWGIVVPGERDVFFLKTGDGVLRTTVDLYPSHIEVLSGRHVDYKPRPGQSIEESIAEILLTPAEDVRPDAFSQGLRTASAIGIELLGQSGTLRIMKPLLESKESVLRQQACSVMLERFPGQVQCSLSRPM